MNAVSESGIRIMSDSWISWNPRIDDPSNPRPSSNTSVVSCASGDGEVLHQARQVAEPDVDDLDVLVGDEAEHLVGGPLVHGRYLRVVSPHANNWLHPEVG